MADPFLMLALVEGGDEGMVPELLDPALEPERALAEPPPDLPPRVLRRLFAPDLAARADAVLAAATRTGLRWVTPRMPGWPAALGELPVRPLGLFVRGDVAALRLRPALALVGSRTPTPYGRHAAETFAAALARAGIVLWSGLARGIDALAHAAATAAGTPTVAVLAGGLDRIYPPEHHDLAERIVRGGGCLVAEVPPGRRARRGHFPRRNRILAAGAQATFVVEAGVASGALHTARWAAECGRAVFALPGPWTSDSSRGCHRLLQEGASVAADPIELLRDLGVAVPAPEGTALRLQGSADAEAILALLRLGPRPADLVQREAKLPRARFLQARFELEAAGRLRSLPGDLLAPAPGAGAVSR